MIYDASVNYLINIVGNELKHAEHVSNFLLEKEQALIKNDTTTLRSLILKEHSLYVKSRELELSRISVLEVIAKKIGAAMQGLTLTVLIERLDTKYRTVLTDLKNKLLNILGRIKHQNIKCELLLKKSMEIICYSIRLMSGNVREKNKIVYNKNKKPEEKYYSNSILDKRG